MSTQLLVSSSTPATFLPHNINCCTAPQLLDFIQLILYEVALFAQSAKCVFEYYAAFTLGIWSMLLNAHDLFFPSDPTQYNYFMVQCFSEPLHTHHLPLHLQQFCITVHAAWVPIITNAEFSVPCTTTLIHLL